MKWQVNGAMNPKRPQLFLPMAAQVAAHKTQAAASKTNHAIIHAVEKPASKLELIDCSSVPSITATAVGCKSISQDLQTTGSCTDLPVCMELALSKSSLLASEAPPKMIR